MRIPSRRGALAGRWAQRGGAQRGALSLKALERLGVRRNLEAHNVVVWEVFLREEEGRAVATNNQLVVGSRWKTAGAEVPHLDRL